jgi:scyllo-inositol 2-dehydrogenase (NADP+)
MALTVNNLSNKHGSFMNPVKTALSSYGMSGLVFHAPLLHANEGFEICKILERTSNNSAAKYPYARIVRSFDDLLRDDDIELIVVNTPDNTHYELARKAISAGKHVVVEKPFTLEYTHAKELIELAEKKSVVLSVFHNRRWDGDFLTIRKIIEGNLLGRIVEFESHFDRYRNIIKTESWKEDATTGTGNLFNLGSHLIDQVLVLFGNPVSVIADVRSLRNGSTVDDSFELWLGYENIKVSVCGSLLVREQGPRYSLHGTEGSFLKWGLDPQEEALKRGFSPGSPDWGIEDKAHWGVINTSLGGSAIRGTYETLPGCYQEFYNDIYLAIRTGVKPAVTADQAARVVRIIEAARESNRKGISVQLNI